jgi:GNAT superfamily N-acetyltransferase
MFAESPPVFVPASAHDAEALVVLRIAAMRDSLERVGRFDPARARERFLVSFAPQHTHHIVQAGQNIGFYVLRPEGAGLLLDHLYIHPGQQGQGTGAAVLAHVFAQADAQGLPLRVGALRQSDSNRFYVRHGFVLVEQGEFDNYYLRPPAPLSAGQ